MNETLVNKSAKKPDSYPENHGPIEGEQLRAPNEPIIIGNDAFIELVNRCKETTHKSFDDQAVVLLNSILMGNSNTYIRLDPDQESRPWVNRFRAIIGHDYKDSEFPVSDNKYPHPRPQNRVLERLVIAEADDEIDTIETHPQQLIGADAFYGEVSRYAAENRTAFDYEALETLKALLESRQGSFVVALPRFEENTPWYQAFARHCKETGSSAMNRLLTYDAIDHQSTASSDMADHQQQVKQAA